MKTQKCTNVCISHFSWNSSKRIWRNLEKILDTPPNIFWFNAWQNDQVCPAWTQGPTSTSFHNPYWANCRKPLVQAIHSSEVVYHQVNSRGKDAIKLKEVHIRRWRRNLLRYCDSWNPDHYFLVRDLLPICRCTATEVAGKAFVYWWQAIDIHRIGSWIVRSLDQVVCTDHHHPGYLLTLGRSTNSEVDLGEHRFCGFNHPKLNSWKVFVEGYSL